tara:strand:- start:31 stop:1299 length:1269 start_codon:yes stop_codon:yes gene_type:complete
MDNDDKAEVECSNNHCKNLIFDLYLCRTCYLKNQTGSCIHKKCTNKQKRGNKCIRHSDIRCIHAGCCDYATTQTELCLRHSKYKSTVATPVSCNSIFKTNQTPIVKTNQNPIKTNPNPIVNHPHDRAHDVYVMLALSHNNNIGIQEISAIIRDNKVMLQSDNTLPTINEEDEEDEVEDEDDEVEDEDDEEDDEDIINIDTIYRKDKSIKESDADRDIIDGICFISYTYNEYSISHNPIRSAEFERSNVSSFNSSHYSKKETDYIFKNKPSRICTHTGCTNKAQRRGVCHKHGGSTRSICRHPGCPTRANARGLCCKHGGGTWSVCEHPECTTKAVARGLCKKHGCNGACQHPGCPTSANVRGLCVKHGGVTRSACLYPGCTTNAQARGLCFKHGCNGVCQHPGCTTNAQVRGLCRKHGPKIQ